MQRWKKKDNRSKISFNEILMHVSSLNVLRMFFASFMSTYDDTCVTCVCYICVYMRVGGFPTSLIRLNESDGKTRSCFGFSRSWSSSWDSEILRQRSRDAKSAHRKFTFPLRIRCGSLSAADQSLLHSHLHSREKRARIYIYVHGHSCDSLRHVHRKRDAGHEQKYARVR